MANVTGAPREGLAQADAALAIIAANGERHLDAARLHLTRAVSLAALGDADTSAAKIAIEGLKAQFEFERAKVVAALA